MRCVCGAVRFQCSVAIGVLRLARCRSAFRTRIAVRNRPQVRQRRRNQCASEIVDIGLGVPLREPCLVAAGHQGQSDFEFTTIFQIGRHVHALERDGTVALAAGCMEGPWRIRPARWACARPRHAERQVAHLCFQKTVSGIGSCRDVDPQPRPDNRKALWRNAPHGRQPRAIGQARAKLSDAFTAPGTRTPVLPHRHHGWPILKR